MKGFLTTGPKELVDFAPNDAQRPFLMSRATERWMICGNRTGKSYVGTVDIILDCAGVHQYRPRFSWPYDPEKEFAARQKRGVIQWWSCAPDFPNVWEITQKKYFRKLTHAFNAVWRAQDRKFVWEMVAQGPSGKTYQWACEVFAKSYDAGQEKYQSAGLAGVWFDEEPPYGIYDEATTRFDADWDLWVLGTMTPVNGMTWVYDQIYLPWESGTGEQSREVFKGSMLDNLPNLPKKMVERRIRMYPEGTNEYAIRIRGDFIRRAGLIWPEFSRDIHVIDDFDPRTADHGTYTLYRAIDPGWNNPTACVWAAVSREGEVFIYREYAEKERPLSEHTEIIRGMSPLDERYRYTVIDPAARQSDPVSGQSILDYFTTQGIPCIAGDNDVNRGISVVADYLRPDEHTKRPRLFICRSCRMLIKEMMSYSWKRQSTRASDSSNPADVPQKKDDHLVDSVRYLLVSKPSYWQQRPIIDSDPILEDSYTGY